MPYDTIHLWGDGSWCFYNGFWYIWIWSFIPSFFKVEGRQNTCKLEKANKKTEAVLLKVLSMQTVKTNSYSIEGMSYLFACMCIVWHMST